MYIAQGFYGIYLSHSEVAAMYRHWCGAVDAPTDAQDTDDSAATDDDSENSLDEDDQASDWIIGQAEAAGLGAAFGVWFTDTGSNEDGLYCIHLLDAPQLEGTPAELAAAVAALRDLDVTDLLRFCSETLHFPSAPAAEYRVMQVLE